MCMVAPVSVAFYKGRFWCGNFCPRGSFYDHVLAKISPKKSIPPIFKSSGLRVFMVLFIITVFSIQIYATWGDLYAMGTVFVRLILITTSGEELSQIRVLTNKIDELNQKFNDISKQNKEFEKRVFAAFPNITSKLHKETLINLKAVNKMNTNKKNKKSN